MRLYLVSSDLAFSLLQGAPEDAWNWKGGIPVSGDWVTPELILADGGAERFIPVDCFTMNTGADGLILSPYGRASLASLLRPAGEFWPVRVHGHEYWWFNCLACVTLLDRANTDADWSSVEGPWGSFRWITSTRRLAFRSDELTGAPPLFRVPEYPQGALFGGDALLDAVDQYRLTGFDLSLVWSAADGGITNPPGIGIGRIFTPERKSDVAKRRAVASAILAARRPGEAGN